MRRLLMVVVVVGALVLTSAAAGEVALATAPTVTSVSPDAGSIVGGNPVTIVGTNFAPGASVSFGLTGSASVTFVSATELKAVVPAHASGVVDVTVTSGGAASAISSKDLYAYGPPTLSSFTPASGITGSSVAVSGTNFVPRARVRFGILVSPSVSFVTPTQLNVVVPNGATPGSISVTTSAGTATSIATFTPTFSITGFTPANGPSGTVVTINGVGFNGSSAVKFHGAAAASVTHVSATQLQATVPAAVTTGPITVTNLTAPLGSVRSAANYTAGSADLATTLTQRGIATPGGSMAYTMTVTNNGPDTASKVSVTDPTPPPSFTGVRPTTFLCVGSPGTTTWCGPLPSNVSCSSPPVGSPGTVTCTTASLAPGASMTVTMGIVVGFFLHNQAICDTATAVSATFDPNTANNAATVCARVN